VQGDLLLTAGADADARDAGADEGLDAATQLRSAGKTPGV
jgi:hypothetical protein